MDDSINKKFSRARITQVQCGGRGKNLNDCLTPQHNFMELTVESAEGRRVFEMSLSYEQFVELLTTNLSIPVTIDYRIEEKTGLIVKDEVPVPESVRDRAVRRLDDVMGSVQRRAIDLKKDIYEMLNSGKPVGKNALRDLLHDAEVVCDHLVHNEAYVMERAAEEIEQAKSNAKTQLSIFLASQGVEAGPERLSALISTSDVKALPAIGEWDGPVIEEYELKEREQKPIAEMTTMEMADALYRILRRVEKDERVQPEFGHGEHSTLFNANASSSTKGVHVTYISYQGTTLLDKEVARRYLQWLVDNCTGIKTFKRHFEWARHIDGKDA